LYKIEVASESEVKEDASEPEAVDEAESLIEVASFEEVKEDVPESETVVEAEPIIEVTSVEEVVPEPEAVDETEPLIEVASVEEDASEPEAHVEPEVIHEEIVDITPESTAPIEIEQEQVVETALELIALVEAESVEEDVVIQVDTVEEIEAPIEEVVTDPEVVEPVAEEITNIEPVIEPLTEVYALVEDAVEVEAPTGETLVVAEESEPEPVEVKEVFEPVVEAEQEVVAVPEYDPDPLIKEIMGNLAKNISMKIRLVDLHRTGGVKPEIFGKLFDSYQARGELLMNSRSEMLDRVRYDLGSMERALYEAKEGLEELEIRRTIDDVSVEEYAAKAPGFEWDIGQYKDEVGKKQAGIYYLEDIKRVMSSEEIDELVGLGESCFEALDELTESEGITGETAVKIRVSLEEALACIR
jgi:hypothetical protein